MNKAQNGLSLIPSGDLPPQPADGHSTVSVDAKAYVNYDDVYSAPDPAIKVIFELPADSGATFTDSLTNQTSRMTRLGSGRIVSPVLFSSSKPVDKGQLKGYWETDPDRTLQTATFTFTGYGATLKPKNNFVPADGKTTITLEVTLSDPTQAATVTFSEATGTVTFDPPSARVEPGKTGTTNATSAKAGAYFVSAGSGAEPVELDFMAVTLPHLNVSPQPSTSGSRPTVLAVSNKFDDIVGFGLTFYVQLPSYDAASFVSVMLESARLQFGNLLKYSSNDGSAVSGSPIYLPGSLSDMNTMDRYVGAFFSTEKMLWLLHDSDQPIFGLD
ncbi:MAG TPA: hypothetical protein VL635_06570 [Trinickia sp.]|nr:hypothetical protein [Trinickia sp.]